MIYFLVMSAILAVLGLAAASAAQDAAFALFGYGLFGFAVLFALFLVKRHFDAAEGARP
jgi:bacteriorhodopsin